MISNDNIRDIVSWELPEVKEIGVCVDCGQLSELEGGFCEQCLIELDTLCDTFAYDDSEVNLGYYQLIKEK